MMPTRSRRNKPPGDLPGLPPPTEAEVSAQVVEAARLLGLVLERQNTGGAHFGDRYVKFGLKGNPDWIATLPGGRRLGLEIKRPGKRPTPEQMARLRALNEAGAVGLWTDDASKFFELMPHIISGRCRVEFDSADTPWITDEPEEIEQPKP